MVRTYGFGKTKDGRPVTAAELGNENGMIVIVLNYGATIQSMIVPGSTGQPVDVVLGYDTIAEYEEHDGYLGATVGRVANRISGAKFTLNGEEYHLAANDGNNHIHGGITGFSRVIWDLVTDSSDESSSAVFTHRFPDGEDGYPGNLDVKVTFTLDNRDALSIHYEAESDKDTIISLTNHSYFNINGNGDILGHCLQIDSIECFYNDSECLPIEDPKPVKNTPFDFKSYASIGETMDMSCEQLKMFGGYDHGYMLCGTSKGKRRLSEAAVLAGDENDVSMTVLTDRPVLHLYTSNCLTSRKGKNGMTMGPHSGVCLETGWYTNAINDPYRESPILAAGEKYDTTTVFEFENKLAKF